MTKNYPDSKELRERATSLENDAGAIADSSEYPRVAAFTVAGQVESLRNFAQVIDEVGTIPEKRPGMTGEERRDRRSSILRIRAARLKVKAAEHNRTSHDIGCRIPFGQPILVGHHSERGHRRAIERMHAQTSKFCALSGYADKLESRADSAERSHAISASDSDAIEQYRAKLAKLTAERDNMKMVNAAWRKFERTKDNTELLALGFDAHKIETLQLKIANAYSWEKQPFVKWQISNLGAVVRDTQKKLEAAEVRATMPETSSESETGVRLEDSPADNRVRLFFPGKPAAEIRTGLKRNGFRWAPSLGCWQAFRNWHSQQHAATFMKAQM